MRTNSQYQRCLAGGIALLFAMPLSAQHPVANGTPSRHVAAPEPVSTSGLSVRATGSSCTGMSAIGTSRTVVPETAGPGFASFIDPTARIESGERVMIGCRSFVAPFASLDGSLGPIAIGNGSNIQDNVLISGKLVVLGDNVIVAHGATITGMVTIGATNGKPAFVGFNSLIEGASIEPDAMVTHLVRLSPGITVHAGMKILPGKWIRTQREADDTTLGKAARMTDADREFMAGVLHVNTALSAGYADLQHSAPAQLSGAGRDPGYSDFNRDSDMPMFAGKAESHPEFANRLIGAVNMADSFDALGKKFGRQISIRADEGERFKFGTVGQMQDRVTFHALEHSNIEIGNNSTFGYHVVVHGGADDANDTRDIMRIGDDVVVRDWAVLFRSKVGAGVVIGVRAYVDGCQLAAGTVVPDRAIMIKNKLIGYVEW